MKKIARVLGLFITGVCFIFIFKIILSMKMDWNIFLDDYENIFIFVGISILGSLNLYFVAYAWSLILKFVEPNRVPNRQLAYIYIKANIAKYLPGNVLNLVGRNVLAGKLGLSQKNITISTFFEIIFFATTTLILSALFSINKISELFKLINRYVPIWILFSIFLIILTILILIILKNNKYFSLLKKYLNIEFIFISIKAMGLYSVYFIFSGSVLSFILSELLSVDVTVNLFFQLIGVYVISYFIGYITPGAPGGIGVRETILVLLITELFGTDIAVISSILHRIFTILSDVFIYIFVYILTFKKNPHC